MGVPKWLLKIVMGFLSERKLQVSFKGAISAIKLMPGGSPQGTVLGMFLFIILINIVGFKGKIDNIGDYVTEPFRKRKPMQTFHAKFIDDLTLAESLNLREKLKKDERKHDQPLLFHQRTGHFLPEDSSNVQLQINYKLYS